MVCMPSTPDQRRTLTEKCSSSLVPVLQTNSVTKQQGTSKTNMGSATWPNDYRCISTVILNHPYKSSLASCVRLREAVKAARKFTEEDRVAGSEAMCKNDLSHEWDCFELAVSILIQECNWCKEKADLLPAVLFRTAAPAIGQKGQGFPNNRACRIPSIWENALQTMV